MAPGASAAAARRLILWLLALSGAGNAHAESTTALPTITIQSSRELSGAWFGEATSLAETPWSATRLLLDEHGGADRLESLANPMAGIIPAVVSAQMDTAIGMRGFDAARIYVDGLPDLRRRHVRDLSSLAMSEFLRGHASVNFANGSPAGVVALTLKAPDGVRRRQGEASAGSGAYWRGSFDLGDQARGDDGQPERNGLRWRLAGAVQDGEGRLTSAAPFSLRRQAVYAAFSQPLGPDTTLRIDADLQHNERPYSFGTVLQRGQPVYDAALIGPANHADRDYARAALRLQHGINAHNQVRLVLQNGHSQRNEVMHGFYAKRSEDELSGYLQRFTDRARQHDALLEWHNETPLPGGWGGRLNSRLGVQHGRAQTHFVGGQNINGFRLRINQPVFSIDPWSLPLTARLFREASRETGAYVQSTAFFDSGWQLSAGLRQQRSQLASDRSGRPLQTQGELDALTSSLTALYRLAPSLSFWGNLGSSSDLNTGYDRFGQLLPERQTRQHELGSHWEPHPGRHLRLATYVLRQTHLPEIDPLDRSASVSSGARETRGAELEGGWTWSDGRLAAHVSHLRSHLQRPGAGLADTTPAGVPRRVGGITWQQRLPGMGSAAPTLSAQLWGMAARHADTANQQRVAGFGRLDLALRWQQDGWHWSLDLRNAADRRYIEAVNGVDDVYPGERRSLVLSTRINF